MKKKMYETSLHLDKKLPAWKLFQKNHQKSVNKVTVYKQTLFGSTFFCFIQWGKDWYYGIFKSKYACNQVLHFSAFLAEDWYVSALYNRYIIWRFTCLTMWWTKYITKPER